MRDLQKDLQLCNAATPGPWTYRPECYGVFGPREDEVICSDAIAVNEAFIAEAREGWPEAIRRAMEAEALVGKLKWALRELLYAGQCDICLLYDTDACRGGLDAEACVRIARSQARQVLEEV